jgi:hypothetical protein
MKFSVMNYLTSNRTVRTLMASSAKAVKKVRSPEVHYLQDVGSIQSEKREVQNPASVSDCGHSVGHLHVVPDKGKI